MESEYDWRILFLVNSEESNLTKFAEGLLPKVVGGECISGFECADAHYSSDGRKWNSVCIMGSKVVSVECYNGK